jgi:hypothetical protein
MSETSSKLTTALQVAQSRLPTISTNPIGASAHLTQQAQDLSAIDFQGEIDKALDSLKEASSEYDANRDTPNVELVEARNEVFRLRAALTEAEAHLKTVEAKGSWLDQFANAVASAERSVSALVDRFSRLVTNQLMQARFGQVVAFGALGRETKNELRLHARLTQLKKFHISRDERNDQQNLYRRAEAVFG